MKIFSVFIGCVLAWTCSIEASSLLVGYYTNWSQYRPGAGSCKPSNLSLIAPKLSDLNYAFLFFNYQSAEQPAGPTNDWKIHFSEWNDSTLLQQTVGLKSYNPALRIFVSIGGWNFNDPTSSYGSVTMTYFSEMCADSAKYNAFIQSAFDLCSSYELQGIDIDWEYPGVPARGGSSSDYQNFANFAQAFRSRIDSEKEKILLTAAVPAIAPSGFIEGDCQIGAQQYHIDPSSPQSYIDWLSAVSVFFDWYNVMTYDYAGPWQQPTGENAPLQPLSSGASCVQSTVASYLQGKTPASKIVVGVPSYAHTFAGVVFPSSLEGQPYGPGCSFSGAGYPGYYTGQAGMLAYYEVIGDLGCNVFQGTQVNPITETSYIWNGSTGAWASFDLSSSAHKKGAWIFSQQLGGGMIYALDLDNFMDPISPFSVTSSLSNGLLGQ